MKEYQIWYSDGLGTIECARSKEQAIERVKEYLPENSEIISVYAREEK